MPSRSRWLVAVCATVVLLVGWSASRSEQEPARAVGPGMEFRKTGRVVLDLGGPGSFDECNAKYPCVLRVGDEWWMWYNGRAADCFTGQVGLAISDDGFHWQKVNQGQPVMSHGPAGSFDETKVDHPTVVYFNNRFHMWYTGGLRFGCRQGRAQIRDAPLQLT